MVPQDAYPRFRYMKVQKQITKYSSVLHTVFVPPPTHPFLLKNVILCVLAHIFLIENCFLHIKPCRKHSVCNLGFNKQSDGWTPRGTLPSHCRLVGTTAEAL